MRTITHIDRMQKVSDDLKKEGKTIGFVPTMGFIHEGHLSLIDIANKNADVTVASLFVNPKQFTPTEDYRCYPRNLARDKKLLKKRGCSIFFYPDVDAMYSKYFKTEVYVRNLSKLLCGVRRKTHFKGVTTVVAKLFNILKPDIAVFGQKDAQQVIILKRMVEDLNFDVKIVIGPIIREDDGLAMSSRNIYLKKKEREEASVIFKSLKEAEKMIHDGERNASRIKKRMRRMISTKKSAAIDYIRIVETKELRSVNEINGEILIAVACFFGKARLIDNIIINL
ncbi:pantoate--beta-alanine ligase [candidate division WOR-3 bacterium]|nr:pantoate--beta-alanine ligase [candidate division WOR-3 bacterium]